MAVSVEVPSLGESITEAIIGEWRKSEGEFVEEDEILVELETDKIAVEVPAPVAGVLSSVKARLDDTVNVGDVIAEIDSDAQRPEADEVDDEVDDEGEEPDRADEEIERVRDEAISSEGLSPAVRRLVEENDLDPSDVEGTGPGGRILKGDVLKHVDEGKSRKAKKPPTERKAPEGEEPEERVKMSRLRQTVARRLVEAQQNAAMLTTFNEIDMSAVMETRNRYKQKFQDRYDIKLGFMSFFVKAAITALKEYPAVNAEIDGDEIIYKNYYHVGVAVGGPRGLVVPVIKHADRMSFAEVELAIADLAGKAQNNRLTLDDLQGGTFTISNGGIYGSMLSTPILNPPQVGILGMHNIVERPVVIDGEIEVRPVMYVALSYDHRIIDGKEAVSFLYRLKECIEDPERILLEI